MRRSKGHSLLLLFLLLGSLNAFSAVQAHRSECGGLFFRLIKRFTTPGDLHMIPFDARAVADKLPEVLPEHRPSGWLRKLIYSLYPVWHGSIVPRSTHALTAERMASLFTPGEWYNIVITDEAMVAAPAGTTTRDFLSKHIGLADRKAVRFAGLLFSDGHGNLYVTNESGTYQPPASLLPGVKALLEEELPGIHVETVAHLGDAELKARIYSDEPDTYHQDKPAFIDEDGDVRLLRQVGHAMHLIVPGPRRLAWDAQYRAERQNRRGIRPPSRVGYRIGEKKAVIVPRLMNMLRQTMQEFPELTPHLGLEPQWSPEAYRFLHSKMWPLPTPTKIVLALAVGRSSDFCTTGLETQLEARLMAYADHSVQIHDVFREAYRLAKGDLTSALLTAENVLSHGALDPKRDRQPLQQKLAYIRNDSKPLGDNFGAWYHMFGLAVFALHNPHPTAIFVGESESLMSRMTSPTDVQEENANRAGVELGWRLKQMIESGHYRDRLAAGARTDYMNLTEFAH